MEWSNENALDFLEVFQTEPCLWDPRSPLHKNRAAQQDAWRRVVQKLPFTTTVEEVKKKKDSLMGYYRIHLNRYKKSLKSGAATSDVYSTNWFAFEIMDRFLKPVYEKNKTINTETSSSASEVSDTSEAVFVIADDIAIENTPNNNENINVGSEIMTESGETSTPRHNTNVQTKTPPRTTKKMPQEIIAAKKQMDEAFTHLKALSHSKRSPELDEYDHFAMMISSKIRKIKDLTAREILMSDIHTLVVKEVVKDARAVTTQAVETTLLTSYPSSLVVEEPIYATMSIPDVYD